MPYGNSVIETFRFQWYFIRRLNSRSEYHSAKAEYHCEAIELAERRIKLRDFLMRSLAISRFLYLSADKPLS